jgi:hypothetical protein
MDDGIIRPQVGLPIFLTARQLSPWEHGLVGAKRKLLELYRLVWATKVALAAICLDISSASFGILERVIGHVIW